VAGGILFGLSVDLALAGALLLEGLGAGAFPDWLTFWMHLGL
jgi:hypothetical protein